MNIKGKIEDYLRTQEQMKHFKKLEARLRIELLDDLFPGSNDITQKETFHGYNVKGKFSNSIKLTSDFDTLKDTFSPDELDCISYKPTLSLKKYKELDDTQRIRLDECIVVKASMPTLEISTDE